MKAKATRVAVVTGGTRGIGQAITERLALENHQVIALYLSDELAATALCAQVRHVSPPHGIRVDAPMQTPAGPSWNGS